MHLNINVKKKWHLKVNMRPWKALSLSTHYFFSPLRRLTCTLNANVVLGFPYKMVLGPFGCIQFFFFLSVLPPGGPASLTRLNK